MAQRLRAAKSRAVARQVARTRRAMTFMRCRAVTFNGRCRLAGRVVQQDDSHAITYRSLPPSVRARMASSGASRP
jgi:hypothetical protein